MNLIDELPGYFLTERILPALLYPGRQPAEADRTGDVINEEHGVDVTVVVLHHRLPEALLSRRVPQLELMVRRGENKKEESEMRPETQTLKRGNEKKQKAQRGKKKRKSCVEIRER